MKTLYGMDFSDEAYVKLVLKSMVISFIFYSIIYKILRKVVGVSPEYNCRIITFVHGLISCFSAVSYVVLPSLGYYKVESIPSTLILTHSMGYFVFDLIWCFKHGETAVMKFHHILTVTGLFYYSFKIVKQFYIVYSLGLTEITNPFLQFRWFLKHHGMREGLLFRIVEAVLIVMFFIIRVVVLSYYALLAFVDKEMDFNVDDLAFTTLGVATGYALSYQMFNYIVYQFKKSKRNKQLLKDQ